MDEQSLNKIIEQCKDKNRYTALISCIGRIFSSRDLLAQSFQKKSPHIDDLMETKPKDSKKWKKEDIRSLEGDLDKDEDSCCTGIGGKKRDRSLPKKYTDIDLASLRRSIGQLLEIKPTTIYDALNTAVRSLALSISVDLRLQTQRDKIEEIITVLVIVFELIIAKSDFVDDALPELCKAAAYLPVWAQARLASILAEHCREGLAKLLESLQQLVTFHVISGEFHDNVYVQDNIVITSATKVMKVIVPFRKSAEPFLIISIGGCR